MKVFKVILVMLILGGLIIAMFGCGGKSSSSTTTTQIATVKRGNLTLDITAAGNLALSHTEDLAVDLFYPTGTKGTIGSVLVQEGDSVKEGQVLVTLDTSEWDNQLKIMKKSLDTAQRNVITKSSLESDAEIQYTALQRQVTVKENDVVKAQRLITAKELAVRQAELNVQTANNTLLQITEVKTAQDAVDNAQEYLRLVKMIMQGVFVGEIITIHDISYWNLQKILAQQELADAQQDLQNILKGTNLSISTDVALQIAQKQFQVDQYQYTLGDAQIALEDAKWAVDDANIAVDNSKRDVIDAQQSIDNAKIDLTDAQTTLEDTQKDYDEATSLSPEIKAPFDGFVTKVNVAGGDEVLNGTVAVQIADPNKFEADILVSEMDITQVKLGGQATVAANAMTGTAFPAKVTHIAPTATIQSGVVNYTVKVELDELNAASANQTTTSTANTTAGGLPPRLQSAVDSGRITQAQAEELAKNIPAGGFTIPEGTTLPGTDLPSFSSGQSLSQVPVTTSQDFELREGLTVTVNIIASSRTNVLLVPNGAVTKEGAKSYVQVVNASGSTEKREVTTGISNWQYTEITDGLSEGEQVVVTLNTSSSSSTTQRGGSLLFGGPGG